MSDKDYPEYEGITDFINCMFEYGNVVDPEDTDNAAHELVIENILKASTLGKEIARLDGANCRLKERNELLEGALRPFAAAHHAAHTSAEFFDPYKAITLHDLRMAAEALDKEQT